MNQKSIFAASQRAAKMVEQDRPVIDFARTSEERVRDHLRAHYQVYGFDHDQIEKMITGYNLITEVRKKLGIKDQ